MPADGFGILTPGRFLIGRPLIALPAKLLSDSPVSPLKRWNLYQKISSEIWKRWSQEYLRTLQRRHKWIKLSQNFKVGDIVLIKDQDVLRVVSPRHEKSIELKV